MLSREHSSPMTGLRITRVETLHSGFLRLLKLAIATPGGSALQREVEDHGDAVAVLPYDPANRRALLARQFRAPVLHAATSQSDPRAANAPQGWSETCSAERQHACAHHRVGLNLSRHLELRRRRGLFTKLIRAGTQEELRQYAYTCVQAV